MHFISLIPIIVCFVTGLTLIKHVKPVFLYWIIVLMGITLITETTAIYFGSNKSTWKYINIVYNVFSFFDMGIWYYVFLNMMGSKKLKIVVFVCAALVFSLTIIELDFFRNLKHLHSNSLRVYSLTIIALSIIKLNSKLLRDHLDLFKSPLFYVCAGCIIYHGVLFGNLTMLSEISNRHLDGIRNIFIILQNIANVLYYSLLCASFVVCYLSRNRNRQFCIPE